MAMLMDLLTIHLLNKFRVSPIGIAVGKYSGTKRLIIDLSSPRKSKCHFSINELTDKEQCSLQYVKIDDAIKNYVNLVKVQRCPNLILKMHLNNI